MIKIAVYGKGGIGKSTTVSNVAAALAEKGLKVMQIGCDPKADSTMQLRHGEAVPTVLELVNQRKNDFELEDMVRIGFGGVVCVEAQDICIFHHNNVSLSCIHIPLVINAFIIIIFFNIMILFIRNFCSTLIHYFAKISNTSIKQFKQ